MIMKEFVFPLCRDDLLVQGSRETFYVSKRLSTPQLAQAVKEAADEVSSGPGKGSLTSFSSDLVSSSGVVKLANKFNVYFSLIIDAKKVHIDTVNTAWQSCLDALSKVIRLMTSTGFNDKATGEELQSLRNGLKMTCYVITELMCFYEDTISSQAEISSIANQGKRRKHRSLLHHAAGYKTSTPRVTTSEKHSQDVFGGKNGSNDLVDVDKWSGERQRALSDLADLFACRNLSSLWANCGDSSGGESMSGAAVVEEALVRAVLKSVAQCLENPEFGKSQAQNNKSVVAELLSKILSNNPHHVNVIGSKLVNVLKMSEKAVPMVAEVTLSLVQGYGHTQLFVEMLRDIGHTDSADSEMAAAAGGHVQDSEATRSLAAFLSLLAPRLSHLFFKWFCFLMPHFQQESYSFRVALCFISGEVLLYAFKKNTHDPTVPTNTNFNNPEETNCLTEQQRKSRDELLDELQYHVHDVHANVRARAVATLNMLIREMVIPVSTAVDLLQFVAPSLDDTSSNVRKNVIQFLTYFIMYYPYAFRFRKQVFEAMLNEEKAALLKVLQATDKENEQSKIMTREDAEKKWDEMSPFVIKALLKVVNKKETTSKKMNKMAVDKETSSINETTEGEAEEADKGDEEGMEEGSEGQSKEDTEKARVDKLTIMLATVRNNLEAGSYNEAIEGIQKTQEEFPTCPLFLAASKYPGEGEGGETSMRGDTSSVMMDESQSEATRQRKLRERKMAVLHDLLKAVYIAPYAKLSINSDAIKSKMMNNGSGENSDPNSTSSNDQMSMRQDLQQILNELDSMTQDQIETLIQKFKTRIIFLQKCVKIQKIYSRFAIPSALNLLHSSTASDVTAAVDFTVVCSQYAVDTPGGQRQLMGLLACEDVAIRTAVVAGFERMYFNGTGDQSRASSIAEKFLNLARSDNCGDSHSSWLSLQNLVCEFVRMDLLNDRVINYLWEVFTNKHEDVHTSEDRTRALALIAMVAKEKPKVVQSNVNVLLKYALQNHGPFEESYLEFNLPMATQALNAISSLVQTADAKTNDPKEPSFKLSSNDDLFVHISRIITQGISCVTKASWIQFTALAVKLIFSTMPDPVKEVTPILLSCFETLQSQNLIHKEQDYEVIVSNLSQANEEIVRRFLSLLGQVAVNFVAFLEIKVMNDIKSQKQKCEQDAENRRASQRAAKSDTVNGGGKNGNRKGAGEKVGRKGRLSTASDMAAGDVSTMGSTAALTDVSMSRSVRKRAGRLSSATANSESSQLGGGHTAALLNNLVDESADYVKHILDEVVVTGADGLLAQFVPLITSCILPVGQAAQAQSERGEKKTMPSAQIRASATSTLAKFMVVSEVFCRQNLRVLFTIMEKDPDPTIRSSALMFTWDLIMCFPNVIEPWTPNVYARLQDKSDQVRLTCANTVCQLILKEMIKVKGQISELAKCIIDPNEQIASQAKYLFGELAKKNNLLYNVLPDLISRLSSNNADEDEQIQKIDDVITNEAEAENGEQNKDRENKQKVLTSSDDEDDEDQEGEGQRSKFNAVIGHIIKLLPKEKLNEAFIEKMCLRFRVVNDSRVQCHHIGYVLSLLHYTDRGFQKLQDNIPNYAPCLRHDEHLLGCFKSIVDTYKKSCKPESKSAVAEFESALQTAFSGSNDAEGEDGDENSEPNGAVVAENDRTPRSTRASRQTSSSLLARQTRGVMSQKPSKGNNQTKQTRSRRAVVEDSSEDEDVENEIPEESSQNESEVNSSQDEIKKEKPKRVGAEKKAERGTSIKRSINSPVLNRSSTRRSSRHVVLSPFSESQRQPEGKRLRKK